MLPVRLQPAIAAGPVPADAGGNPMTAKSTNIIATALPPTQCLLSINSPPTSEDRDWRVDCRERDKARQGLLPREVEGSSSPLSCRRQVRRSPHHGWRRKAARPS